MPYVPVEIINTFNGGANTRDFPEKLQKNQSPNPRGIDFNGLTIRKAKGFSEYGTESETVPGFFLFNHRFLSTGEVLIKTVNDKIKFFDEVTNQSQLLTDTLFTVGAKWFGASFNGYFYGGNGVDNFVRWRASSWGALSAPVLAGAVTIPLGVGEGVRFATAGDGLIEGDTFSWTGVAADTLTGVTGLVSNHASGSRVIAELDSTTYASNPKGSVGGFFKNRIYVRDDANPNILYFSKLADNTNPQDDLANFTISGSGAGDAGFIIFAAPIIDVDIFISGDNLPLFIAYNADGISYTINVLDEGGTTIGSAIPYKVLGADLAAKSMVTHTENDEVLIDSFGVLRAIGYGELNTIVQTSRLSDIIEPSIAAGVIDFSNGCMTYFNRRIFSCGAQNEAEVNNFTLMRDTNPEAFGFYDHWNINALTEHKNDLYGLSSIDGKIFKMLQGLNADGSIISSLYPTAALDLGAPMIYKTARAIRIMGFISSNCNLYVKIRLDETERTFLINGSNQNITDPITGVAYGTVVFGQGVFGGGLPNGVDFKEFFAELEIKSSPHFIHAQILFENNEKDVDFSISEAMIYSSQSDSRVIASTRVLSQQ